MFGIAYNMLCQSSRKRKTNHEAAHHRSKKQKRPAYFSYFFTRKTLNRAKKPYKRSQKISVKNRGFASSAICGPLRPHTGSKGSSPNHMPKKSCNNSAPSADKLNERRYKEREMQTIASHKPRFSFPFQIGCYSPGTEPDHVPYHLYLLVKEAVEIMKRFEWFYNIKDLVDLTRVERKIKFFCFYFYSHLPRDWVYERKNASSLIVGYDTIFVEGRPRYVMSGFTPLGDEIKDEVDIPTQLSTMNVVDIMRIVHSRKTPTHKTFKKWRSAHMLFYCKLCSCFGIDYQHLETASDDDVCLMYMGS